MKLYSLVIVATLILFSSCSDKKNETSTENSKFQTYQSDSLHLSFTYPKNWEIRTLQDKLGIYEELEDSLDDFQENIIIWTEDMPMAISDSLYARAATAELLIKNPLLDIQRLPKRQLGENNFHPFTFEFTNNDSSEYFIFGYTIVKDKRAYNFSCTAAKNKAQGHQSKFESILTTFKPL
jgi:PsbP-like protein